VTRRSAFILILLAQILGVGLSQAQPANLIGSWKVEITFANGESRSLRLEAQQSGKGSFLLLDPRSKFSGAAGPSEAKWTQGDDGAVIFSGTVQFPLGNVGIDRGTLVLKGKMGTEGAITGEAKFFPPDQDRKNPEAKPSKSGTFKAVRFTAG
jgi:hypothetical protein